MFCSTWKWFSTFFGLDPRVTIWHNKKYFLSTFFALTTTWKWFLFGLDPRVTFKHFLSTFFKCHTFLAELSWSVPLPSGGSLLAEFWLISDVIFSTIKSLSLLSHFKLPMIPLLPLMVGLELDNNLTVASYLSLFEQKST